MVESYTPFYMLLEAETPINNTPELNKIFEPVKMELIDAIELVLNQPFRG